MSSQEISNEAGRKARLKAHLALLVFLLATAALFAWNPVQLYLWIKALHLIAVISWMAGLFYLPRLFIYHTDAAPGSQQSETFKIMEQRLLRIIMTPAMLLTWAFGLYLAWSIYNFQGLWLHIKIALVILMTVCHFFFARAVRSFSRDEARRPGRFWRLANEIPTLLMIAIVLLAVVKPE